MNRNPQMKFNFSNRQVLLEGTENVLIKERVNFRPINSAHIYLFKVSNINTRKKCKIFLQLTIEIPEQRRFVSFSF